MSLKLFFEPIESGVFDQIALAETVACQFLFNTQGVPAWKDAAVAIFSMPEYRGAPVHHRPRMTADLVRRAFYRLRPLSQPVRIVDLGVLRPGLTLDESYARLREVCSLLIGQGVIPVLLGGSHDLMYAQFQALEQLGRPVTVANVDARIDIRLQDEVPADAHIHRLLSHLPNYLYEYAHIGYQRYLNDKRWIDTVHQLHFEALSVGQLRDRPQETEPVLRQADLLGFDLSALRRTDFPASPDSHAFGLTGEEASQLCWYAGNAEQLCCVGFYGYQQDLDQDGRSAEVLSVMLWYLLEGIVTRRPAPPDFQHSQYVRYLVPLPNSGQTLVFYRSQLSDKWWIEVTRADGKGAPVVLPCSYADYETAGRGELPERWLRAVQKMRG